MKIEVDRENIYLVDRERSRVSKRCSLKNLELILTMEHKVEYNLVLMFNKDIQLNLLVETNEDRERLLSAILTLRSFAQVDNS